VTKDGNAPIEYEKPDMFALVSQMKHGVDDANRVRQGKLDLSGFLFLFRLGMGGIEEAWRTWFWQNRVFAFLLGMAESNAYCAVKRFYPEILQSQSAISPQDYRLALGTELVSSVVLPTTLPENFPSTRKPDCAFEETKPIGNGKRNGRLRQLQCKECPREAKSKASRKRILVTTCCSCSPNIGRCRDCWNIHSKIQEAVK